MAIAIFVVLAAGFGLAHLSAGAPYTTPAPETEMGRAIESKVAAECVGDEAEIFRYLCRQRILGGHRFQRLRERTGTPTVVVLISAAAIAAGFFGLRAYRWIRQGFIAE